jgi:hypothetical protein
MRARRLQQVTRRALPHVPGTFHPVETAPPDAQATIKNCIDCFIMCNLQQISSGNSPYSCRSNLAQIHIARKIFNFSGMLGIGN